MPIIIMTRWDGNNTNFSLPRDFLLLQSNYECAIGYEMKHFTCSDTTESWQEGWGRFLRLRYLISLTSLKTVIVVVGFFELELPLAIAVFIVLATCLSAIFALRYCRVMVASVNSAFHDLTHTTRDQISYVLASAKDGAYKYAFQEFNSNITENLALIFRKVLNNKGITCAIRLAVIEDKKEYYRTVGRSSGFDLTRKDNSQLLPSNEGVARILRQKNQLGVLIVNDIKEAIGRNTWFETKNDSLPDIKSVMVAPINGYVKDNKSMVGLLFIGAKKDLFTQFHVDIVRAFSDYLGTVYPLIIGRVEKED